MPGGTLWKTNQEVVNEKEKRKERKELQGNPFTTPLNTSTESLAQDDGGTEMPADLSHDPPSQPPHFVVPVCVVTTSQPSTPVPAAYNITDFNGSEEEEELVERVDCFASPNLFPGLQASLCASSSFYTRGNSVFPAEQGAHEQGSDAGEMRGGSFSSSNSTLPEVCSSSAPWAYRGSEAPRAGPLPVPHTRGGATTTPHFPSSGVVTGHPLEGTISEKQEEGGEWKNEGDIVRPPRRNPHEEEKEEQTRGGPNEDARKREVERGRRWTVSSEDARHSSSGVYLPSYTVEGSPILHPSSSHAPYFQDVDVEKRRSQLWDSAVRRNKMSSVLLREEDLEKGGGDKLVEVYDNKGGVVVIGSSNALGTREADNFHRVTVPFRYLLFFIWLKAIGSYDSGAFSAVLGAAGGISDEWELDSIAQGSLTSSVFLGNVIGCPLAGQLLSLYDEKKVFSYSLLFHLLFSVSFGLFPSYYAALVNRFFIGVTLAFIVVYTPVWVDEFAPRQMQSMWQALQNVGVPVGIMLGFLLGSYFPTYTTLSWAYSFFLKGILMVPTVMYLWHMDPCKFNTRRSTSPSAVVVQDLPPPSIPVWEGVGREKGEQGEEDSSLPTAYTGTTLTGSLETSRMNGGEKRDLIAVQRSSLGGGWTYESQEKHPGEEQKSGAKRITKAGMGGLPGEEGSRGSAHLLQGRDLPAVEEEQDVEAGERRSRWGVEKGCRPCLPLDGGLQVSTPPSMGRRGYAAGHSSAYLQGEEVVYSGRPHDMWQSHPPLHEGSPLIPDMPHRMRHKGREGTDCEGTGSRAMQKASLLSHSLPPSSNSFLPVPPPPTSPLPSMFTPPPAAGASFSSDEQQLPSCHYFTPRDGGRGPPLYASSEPSFHGTSSEAERQEGASTFVPQDVHTPSGAPPPTRMMGTAATTNTSHSMGIHPTRWPRRVCRCIPAHLQSPFKAFSVGLYQICTNVVYVCSTLSMCCLYFAATGLQNFVTQYLRGEPFNASMQTIMLGFGGSVVTAPVLGVMFSGFLLDKIGGYSHHWIRTTLFSLFFGVFGSISAVICCFVTTTPSFLVMMSTLLFCGGAIVPPGVGLTMASLPPSRRSAGAALSQTLYNLLGNFSGPLVCGAVAEWTGDLRWGIITILLSSILGVVPLLVIILWGTLNRKRKIR